MTDPLFQPLQVGALELPNRIVMAPLTRCRASVGRVPNSMMADYYAQRASFGLILSEATSVCPHGVGYPDTPGIWLDGQVEGWHLVTQAVHAAGGRIFLQLWHVARELGKRRIAFLCARETHDHPEVPALGPELKKLFGGVFIANESFAAESAAEAVSSGAADAVAFGKAAIANPDLVARIRAGEDWNEPDPDTFYGGGVEGYLDYPVLESVS